MSKTLNGICYAIGFALGFAVGFFATVASWRLLVHLYQSFAG